ncbi:MAG: AsmA family protein [Alphaproteobacteria bacterium]
MAPPSAKKSKLKLILAIIGVLIAVPVIGIGVVVATVNPDDYRGQIAQILSDNMGRKVSLNGKMSFGILGGLTLEINDAAIANPSWASRDMMAKVGKLELAVALMPLLHKQLDVQKIVLNDADILLETNSANKGNWEFDVASPQKKEAAEQKAAAQGAPIELNVREVKLNNVRAGMKGKGDVLIDKLSLQAAGKTDLKLNGNFNTLPFDVKLEAGQWQDFMAGKNWPFTAEASFAGNDLSGSGMAEKKGKVIDLASFKLASAMGSNVTGKLNIDMTGSKPRITGDVNIDKIKPPAPGGGSAAGIGQPAPGSPGDGRLFSAAPFDLSALKSANADVRVNIIAIETDKITLSPVQTHVSLREGRLQLDPLTAGFGGNEIKGRVVLDAGQSPAALALTMNGKQLDLADIQHKMNMDFIPLGKTDLDIDVTSRGDSPRALAAGLDGKINLEVGEAAQAGKMKQGAGDLLMMLSPQTGALANAKLACAAARFTAQNGVVTSNGILLESNVATVAGTGSADLRQESLNFFFKPVPKDASVAQLMSPLHVGGTLAAPVFRLDTASAAANLAGTFLGANIPGVAGNDVRVPIVKASAGGNPCVEALNNPTYPAAGAQTGVASPAIEKGREYVKEHAKGVDEKIGKLLGGDKSPLKGLFGR